MDVWWKNYTTNKPKQAQTVPSQSNQTIFFQYQLPNASNPSISNLPLAFYKRNQCALQTFPTIHVYGNNTNERYRVLF